MGGRPLGYLNYVYDIKVLCLQSFAMPSSVWYGLALEFVNQLGASAGMHMRCSVTIV